MNRLVFIFLLSTMSFFTYAGCVDCAWIGLNGKTIRYLCPNSPNPGIVDSLNFFSNNDTIYLDRSDSNIIHAGGPRASISYGDSSNTTGTFAILNEGKYFFDLYNDDGGCDVYYTLYFFFKTATGIQSINSQSNIKVLSNPVSEILRLSSPQKIESLNIYDGLGRLVLSYTPSYSQQISETNINMLPKGIYNVEILSESDKRDYIKIVKQ